MLWILLISLTALQAYSIKFQQPTSSAPAPIAGNSSSTVPPLPEMVPPAQPATQRVVITIGEPPVIPGLASNESLPPLKDEVSSVAQTVARRIVADSQRLGTITQGLVGVQGDFNTVEQEVLGKTFNLESFQRFVREHNLTMAMNEQLKHKVAELNSHASSLDKQLTKLQAKTSQVESKHAAAMVQMRVVDEKDEAAIEHLSQWLNWLKAIEVEVYKLEEANEEVTCENKKAVEFVKQSSEVIEKDKYETKMHFHNNERLHGEVLKQHQYASQCQSVDAKLQADLDTIQNKRRLEHEAAVNATTHGRELETSLVGESKLMMARLAKGRRNLATVRGQINTTNDDIIALQAEGEARLEKMRKGLSNLRQQAAAVQAELMHREMQRQLEEKEVGSTEAEIQAMKGAMLTAEVAKMRANQTNLKENLQQMHVALTTSQSSAAKAGQDLLAAQQDEEAAKAAAQTATEKAQKVAQDALAKVAAARDQANAAEEQANNAVMEAEASLMVKCDEVWDRKHPDIVDDLTNTCPQVKKDLQTAQALVASLSSTVQSTKAAGG